MAKPHRIRRRHSQRLISSRHFISILPSVVSAVSLSNFSPYASNLTPSCYAVYTATIPGCTPADFSGSRLCSSACLNGLVQIGMDVYAACTSTQDYQFVIAKFLNGEGINALCPNVVVITAEPTPVSPPATSFTPEPTGMSGTSILSSAPVQTSSLMTDTHAPPCVSSTCTDTQSNPTGKASHRHHTTTTSTTQVTSTSRVTRTSTPSKTTSTGQTTTTPGTSRYSPSSSPTGVNAASAAASQCIEHGGDPFSSCSDGFSHNAATSFSAPLAAAVSLISGALCLFFLAVQ